MEEEFFHWDQEKLMRENFDVSLDVGNFPEVLQPHRGWPLYIRPGWTFTIGRGRLPASWECTMLGRRGLLPG